MNQEVTTLAEVFLTFGGQTMYTLGTACTAMGVIYGVHRLTGLGIKIFNNLPIWLGMTPRNPDTKDTEALVTRKQVSDELTTYSKIGMLILFGVLIKFCGNWLGLDSTVQGLNALLYKQ